MPSHRMDMETTKRGSQTSTKYDTGEKWAGDNYQHHTLTPRVVTMRREETEDARRATIDFIDSLPTQEEGAE